MGNAETAKNPIIWADVPDPSVIRVGDTYYMTSTTMHMNPGVPVMKSTNLVDWEIVNYVYDVLAAGDAQTLSNGQNEYGKGSWASSLTYHDGVFYVVFSSQTVGKTFIFRTRDIENGPWDRSTISFTHDMSLLFDDDGRVYLVHGGGDIRVLELTADATEIKADHPIGIEFIGSDAGSIDVKSEKSHIIVAGDVSNRGYTTLKGGSIQQTSDTAIVSGSNVWLEGASIGSKTEPVHVQLLGDSGGLWAQAEGDISIRAVGGDVRLGFIVTSATDGNIWLDADGDIVRGGWSAIGGSRIELVSRTGSIGTASAPMNIEVGDGPQSGLSASAPGDISIYQGRGDLRLIRVESLGGDVTLEAADGSIIDVNPVEQKDTRTVEELNRLWDEMLLIEKEGAEKSAENTINAYKQAKEYEYLRYWGMRNTKPQYDETGNFLGYTWDSYDPEHADPEYHSLHQLYGAAEFHPDWEFIVSAEERNTLTQGVSWTRDELTTALSGGILFKQTTSTETVYKEPNVKGRNITLKAPKGSVGADRGEVVIDGTNSNELKDQTKRTALVAAEPDDVAVNNDTKQITVLLRKPVNVAATGEVIVEARDSVYLSSREPMNVRTVSSASNGTIRIKGKDGVYAVNTSGWPVIRGGRTILEGGDGGLGTSSLPLILQLQAGAALTARAGCLCTTGQRQPPPCRDIQRRRREPGCSRIDPRQPRGQAVDCDGAWSEPDCSDGLSRRGVQPTRRRHCS
jgi:hypothetical protein